MTFRCSPPEALIRTARRILPPTHVPRSSFRGTVPPPIMLRGPMENTIDRTIRFVAIAAGIVSLVVYVVLHLV